MSTFKTVSDWVDLNIVPATKPSDVTPLMLRELQAMADLEIPSLSERVFQNMREYQRENGMRALAALTTNAHNPRHDDYMLNAFGVVLLKADPHGTDGIFVIIQAVPGYYVLKTVIRANRDYIATGVTHTLFLSYDSPLTKQQLITGVCSGNSKDNIFILKNLVDNKQRIDPILEPGSNDVFTYTQPDGKVITP